MSYSFVVVCDDEIDQDQAYAITQEVDRIRGVRFTYAPYRSGPESEAPSRPKTWGDVFPSAPFYRAGSADPVDIPLADGDADDKPPRPAKVGAARFDFAEVVEVEDPPRMEKQGHYPGEVG